MILKKILIVLLLMTSTLADEIEYFNIKNQKKVINCEDRKVFILNHSRIICKECVVNLYKKIKKDFPKALFLIYIDLKNDVIFRFEMEKRIEEYIKPDFFIYSFNKGKLKKEDFLVVINNCEKKIFKRDDVFYKNGKLKKIKFFQK
jgi:hypothetical protein